MILAFLPEFLQDSPFCLLCVFCRLSRCFSTGFLCCLMQKTACSFLKELGFLQTGISLMHSTACPVHRIPEGASRNGPACGTFSFSAYLLRCLLFFPRRSPPFFWSSAGASISKKISTSYLRTYGFIYFTVTIFHKIFSRGSPSFSYIANRNAGSIRSTIHVAALDVPIHSLVRK